MIETVVFLLGQIMVNFLIRWIDNTRLTIIFANLSFLLFGILLFLFPYFSYWMIDLYNPPDPSAFRCGNAQIGPVFFNMLLVVF